MEVEIGVAVALVAAAAAAGFVDAVAGGGGILQLPALLAAGIPLPLALGVNKASSLCGTTAAFGRYVRHGAVDLGHLRRAWLPALLGSAVGALAVAGFLARAPREVETAFAGLLLLVAVRQGAGALRREPPPPAAGGAAAPRSWVPWIAAIALYDGIVGPGAGVFFFWALSDRAGLEPLRATGTAKGVNWLTNAAALSVFVARGQVLWTLGLAMACGNVAGGILGARTAIRRGVRFVRAVASLVAAAACVHLLLRSLA